MLSAPGTLSLVVEMSCANLQQTLSAVTVSKRVRRCVQKMLMLKFKLRNPYSYYLLTILIFVVPHSRFLSPELGNTTSEIYTKTESAFPQLCHLFPLYTSRGRKPARLALCWGLSLQEGTIGRKKAFFHREGKIKPEMFLPISAHHNYAWGND